MPEIRLPVFRGPLELLLQLIQRQDLDITTVSLVAVADQYLTAVHADESLDAPALAEFVSIGARLLHLKSRALLPSRADEEELEPDEDAVGQELVALLHEYQRFRDVADELGAREAAGLRTYARGTPPPEPPPGDPLAGVTLDALYAVMLEVLERVPEEPEGVLERHNVSVTDKIALLEAKLAGRSRSFSLPPRDRELREPPRGRGDLHGPARTAQARYLRCGTGEALGRNQGRSDRSAGRQRALSTARAERPDRRGRAPAEEPQRRARRIEEDVDRIDGAIGDIRLVPLVPDTEQQDRDPDGYEDDDVRGSRESETHVSRQEDGEDCVLEQMGEACKALALDRVRRVRHARKAQR